MAGATKRTSQNSVTAGLQTGRKRPAQRGGRRSLRIGLFFGEMGIYGERAIEAISAAAELHNGKIRILVGRLREISPADVPAGRLDGVILGWWDHPDDLLELLEKTRLPCVDIWGSRPADFVPHKVLPDDLAVGRIAAEHFLKRGFTQFAYYGLPKAFGHQWEHRRQSGFAETVAAAGYPCQCFENTASGWEQLHEEQYLSKLERWLIGLPKPTAILCCVDVMAYEVIRLARKHRIVVPDEIAVCGVDNWLWVCKLATPPISSVPLDGATAGAEALRLLMDVIRGRQEEPRTIFIPPLPLEVRGSTDVYKFPDEEVVRAIRYIRDHSHVPIVVEDIMENSFISRRALEIRFRETTGETLQQAIWRAHVEKAKRLLLESSLPMSDVAEQSGYRSAAVFNVMFRKETGMTPTEFRRRKLKKRS
jgi:LacI family transcriptional regulator